MYDDPDDALDMWLSLVESTVNHQLSWKDKCVKYGKQPQWMTDNMLQVISTRDIYVKDNDFENYKLSWNKVVQFSVPQIE